jgi:hypothetical protein
VHPTDNELHISMFEINPVDSEAAHQYCQNLCYTAKLFLDHKVGY